MIINKKMGMLLPTVQFGNVPIEFSISLDTTDPGDFTLAGVDPTDSLADINAKLAVLVEEELFATKKALESRLAQEFNLQINFAGENAKNNTQRR